MFVYQRVMGKISAFTENNLSEETMRKFSDLVIQCNSPFKSYRLSKIEKMEAGHKRLGSMVRILVQSLVLRRISNLISV